MFISPGRLFCARARSRWIEIRMFTFEENACALQYFLVRARVCVCGVCVLRS